MSAACEADVDADIRLVYLGPNLDRTGSDPEWARSESHGSGPGSGPVGLGGRHGVFGIDDSQGSLRLSSSEADSSFKKPSVFFEEHVSHRLTEGLGGSGKGFDKSLKKSLKDEAKDKARALTVLKQVFDSMKILRDLEPELKQEVTPAPSAAPEQPRASSLRRLSWSNVFPGQMHRL